MSHTQYTSIDRIFSKVVRDFGIESPNESDMIEWTGEALELLSVHKYYEESIAFIEVKNHQAELPKYLHCVIQVAKNNCWTQEIADSNTMCPSNVVEAIKETTTADIPNCGCAKSYCSTCHPDFAILDCDGKIISSEQIAYYRPYYDLHYEYYGWSRSQYYNSCFTPVNLATHNFFHSIVCEETKDNSIYPTSQNNSGTSHFNSSPYTDTLINAEGGNFGTGAYQEYKLIDNMIRVSFKEGQLAVAYLRHPIDQVTGYPLVVDDVSVINAITYYIGWKTQQRDYFKHKEGSKGISDEMKGLWLKYCKQAKNKAMMLNGVDDWENFGKQRNYLLPRENDYYTYFGNLNKSEIRSWNRN